MKIIPTDTRNQVHALVEAGVPVRQIASETKVSCLTVQRIRAKHHQSIQKPRAGRKPKLSDVDKRRVARISQHADSENACLVQRKLKAETGIDVSHDTVNRALKEIGLGARRKVKRPRLLPKHIKARKKFAERFKEWTEDDWRCIIWSDETIVERFGSHGRQWIW